MPMTTAGRIHATATRKAMLRLVPILCLAYFMSYVDRTNIALAKTHLQADVGVSVAAFGLGAGLFFVTYAFLEVPSNLIMYRVGPRRWIARIAITWGMVTALMMFISNEVTFYIGRIALGAAEAGLYPAMMFMVTQWFAQKDRATAIGYIYLAATLGIFLGSPLGGGLMELDSLGGLQGWQWMFLIEGLVTMVVGLVVLVVLPEQPADAKWLTAQEAAALTERAGAGADADGGHSLRGNMGKAFGRPFLLLIGLIYFFNQITINGVTFNVPSIIESLGISGSFLIGLLSGVTGIGGTIGVLLMPALFRRRPREAFTIGALAVGCGVGAAVFLAVPSPVIRILLIGVLAVLMIGTLPIFWAVAMARMSGVVAAAGLAFINTLGLTGGFVGPYLFGIAESESKDPASGFYIVIVVSLIGGVLAVALHRALRHEDDKTAAAESVVGRQEPVAGREPEVRL
ncbi:MFS transporter [Streptomyces sp. B-S-A8]|uniref:MFS transporter n=1 Tax=Streptomyces solicavernae TaxID=3043614 RepID=A0ABT6RYP2_9ACTN|nr:MFS transporter [Streptomyces sp. B-S-A8]MDI3389533.1 MFS transporter [Streptomyces sp. B-S-A8]